LQQTSQILQHSGQEQISSKQSQQPSMSPSHIHLHNFKQHEAISEF